jgi:hypothetical protein
MDLMRRRHLFLGAVFVALAAAAWPESRADGAIPASTSAQIVEQMTLRDQARHQELKHYHSLRHYLVEYRGFSADLTAKMDVKANYNIESGKSFQIISQSGSNFLIEKVLKRAIDSEKEASREKGTTALTSAHYKFKLLGSEMLNTRPAYILDVEPLAASKFLFRGKVWVDAADFAVVKMETQPAKSPSFWISKTLIQCTNAKTGEFWFPEKLRSETRVRIGGAAVLTIDYGKYEMAANPPPPPSR